MPSTEPPPQTEHVQHTDQTTTDLQTKCEGVAEAGGEVTVAIRQFPNADYQFLYDRYEISIVEAKLTMRGYCIETKIVMDSKCSRLVLAIQNDVGRKRIVHAELRKK